MRKPVSELLETNGNGDPNFDVLLKTVVSKVVFGKINLVRSELKNGPGLRL